MPELYKYFGAADFAGFSKLIEKYTPDEHFRNLYEFLQTPTPPASAGLQGVGGALCAAAYFDLVLTTNFDPLMDDALAAAQLWRKDWLLLVNTVIRNDWLARLLPEREPREDHQASRRPVPPLHGLDGQGDGPVPRQRRQPGVAACDRGHDVLVVGRRLHNKRIRDLVVKARTIWYTHPREVPRELKGDKRVRAVIGPECAFEQLFARLAEGLEVPVSKAPASPRAKTDAHAAAARRRGKLKHTAARAGATRRRPRLRFAHDRRFDGESGGDRGFQRAEGVYRVRARRAAMDHRRWVFATRRG